MPKRIKPTDKTAENLDPMMVRRKAQADQDRQADQRCMAEAISRFDAYLRTTSTERLPKPTRGGDIRDDGYLAVRKAAGSGFLSAWPVLMKMLDAELEVRRCRADGLNVVRRLDKVVPGSETTATGKLGRKQIEDERAVGAAQVRRDSMLLPVGAMPPGPLGDALRELQAEDPDAFQIVNLRATRIDGKLMTFREIAKRFRRAGAEGKEYTAQRCQQMLANTMKEYPVLRKYIDGKLADTRTGKLPEDRQTDRDWIKERTTESVLDPSDYGRGIHGASNNSRIRD